MKLALLGRDISHSRSPELYQSMLGPDVDYSLLDYSESSLLPSIAELTLNYSAVNITSPYKEHYLAEVKIPDTHVRSLGAINTIVFKNHEAFATNTDYLAVKVILAGYQKSHADLKLILLGGGVMAKLTILAASELSIPLQQISRKLGHQMDLLDLGDKQSGQMLIINSCSRKFQFRGRIHPDHIFWDFNYGFLPHHKTLPFLVKSYQDGLPLLRLQAEEAVKFWRAYWR